jgi:hypothetical protein
MLERLYSLICRIRNFFSSEFITLTIVRRYQDAQGHNVGELYMYSMTHDIGAYRLIGCSLDSFPIDACAVWVEDALDLEHDFLAPMSYNTLRVGAAEPADNNNVRTMIGRLPRKNMRVSFQNRFIEHVIDGAYKCNGAHGAES